MMIALILAAALSDTPLDDTKMEARAQALMREIRCVSCENEPISQSASEIAGDMRHLVRTQIQEGASDTEVREWFANRYGDFVLFRPKAEGGGAFLWAFPFVLLTWVAGVLWLVNRSRSKTGNQELTPDHEEEM